MALRYFATEHHDKILNRVSQVQTPIGILYLGKNDHVPAVEKFYEKISGFSNVYMCKNAGMERPRLQNIVDFADSESLAMPSFVRPNILSEKRPFASAAFKKKVF